MQSSKAVLYMQDCWGSGTTLDDSMMVKTALIHISQDRLRTKHTSMIVCRSSGAVVGINTSLCWKSDVKYANALP